MTKFAKIFCISTVVVSFAVFWVVARSYVITVPSWFRAVRFLGLPSPPASIWNTIFAWCFIVLSTHEFDDVGFRLRFISTPIALLSIANSLFRGLCPVFPFMSSSGNFIAMPPNNTLEPPPIAGSEVPAFAARTVLDGAAQLLSLGGRLCVRYIQFFIRAWP